MAKQCFAACRTTLEISDELLRRAKRRAADEATTLRQVVEDTLRRYLGGRSAERRYEFRWRTEMGRILRPGVRLDDRDAVRSGGTARGCSAVVDSHTRGRITMSGPAVITETERRSAA